MPQGLQTPEDLAAEVDVAASFAAQGWFLRTGGVGSHDKSVRPKSIRVLVGNDGAFYRAPQVGDAGIIDLPRSQQRSRGISRDRIRSKDANALQAVGRASLGSGIKGPPDKPAPTPRRHPYVPRAAIMGGPEEFLVPDFVVMESPLLSEQFWNCGGGDLVGPLRRSASLFPAVLILLKLRWLVRLDSAVRELCGEGPTASSAGFHHMLESSADIICGLDDHNHSPIQAYEMCIESLKAKLGNTSFPLFLAFVGTHDRGAARNNPGKMPSYITNLTSSSIGSTSLSQACWQAVDDTFVAWLSQQDGYLVASEVIEECEFYGVPPPEVRTRFPKLQAWSAAGPSTRHRYIREARLEVAHLALMLELPSLRSAWALDREDIVQLVREVCAHPKSFNPRIRNRLFLSVLNGPQLPAYNVLAEEMSQQQLQSVWLATTGPTDAGLLDEMAMQKLRDKHPPWLVGGAFVGSRFKTVPPPPVELNDLFSPRLPPPKSPATVKSMLGPSAVTAWKL